MNLSELLLGVMSTATPVLPGAVLLQFGTPAMWAVVLAGCTCVLTRGLPQSWRLTLMVLMAAWALIPGQLSITYWLGLAFQMPSLMTGLICGAWMVAGLTRWRPFRASRQGLDRTGFFAIALGWVLLLDTLALMPWSVYSLGFGTAALVAMSAVVVVIWVLSGGRANAADWSRGVVLAASALSLFALTRLPTGNMWDALLDPWLWVILQVVWLRRLFSLRKAQG